MGFGFFAGGNEKKPRPNRGMPSLELLHKMECSACPLDKARVQHPKLAAAGSENPVVYMLGDHLSSMDDENGRHLSGRSGDLIRPRIPRTLRDRVRWNNVIRTFPRGTFGGGRKPEEIEIECCRPSVTRDIEATKPSAIIGFGSVPLAWAINNAMIFQWRGRRVPVKVGSHVCWYYPVVHPADLLSSGGSYGDGDKHILRLDLERAFREIEEGLPPVEVHNMVDAQRGVSYVTGRKTGDLQRVIDFLERAAVVGGVQGVDYETSAIRPYRDFAQIATASVSTSEATLAWPFKHPQAGWSPQDLKAMEEAWVRYIRAQGVRKAAHNLAFEMEWTAVKYGRDTIRGSEWIDTMSQASILDERTGRGKPGCLALDFQTLLHFGLQIKLLTEVDRKNIMGERLEDVLEYNGIDAKYHRLLANRQEEYLRRDGMLHVYERHLPRVVTTVLTQIKGVPVDQKEVGILEAKYTARQLDIEKSIKAQDIIKRFESELGREFNPGSNTDDLPIVFRDMLGSQAGVRENGKYSVEAEVLEQIQHPLSKLIIEWRQTIKRLGTYITPLKSDSPLIYPDGMLHPVINTVVAETGRTSSEDPNEQNFPKRDEEARELRKQIKPPEGYFVLAVDYGQIQVRNIAMESRDAALVKALWDRFDIHGHWAKKIAAQYPKRIGGEKFLEDKKALKDFRTDVKNQWTFPIFFGAQLSSVAGYLNIPENILGPCYEEFRAAFPDIVKWQERLISTYEKKGYVENLTGRRRHGPLTRNKIINSPIQADEADIVLDAMQRLSEIDWMYQASLEIHDDLTFILPIEDCEKHTEIIIENMLAVPFDFVNVPITVEASEGPNWCDLKEFGAFSNDIWFKK